MSHPLSRVLGAAALAATLAIAGAASATEADTRPRTGPAYRMAAPAGEPPPLAMVGPARREIHSRVVWRAGRLSLRGDVESWSVRQVRVQRKSCESCSWRRHEIVRTGRRGGFRSAISAPRRGSTFWRAKVRAADGYARSFSATWETYY